MNIIKKILNKVKFKQFLWLTIFTVLSIIGVYVCFFINISPKLIAGIACSIFLCFFGMYYFLKRLINNQMLVEYYGDNESNLNKKANILYKSPSHTLLNHIYVTNKYLLTIDNYIKVFSLAKIDNITFIQTKGVINSSNALTPDKWQNTALMSFGRGWPNTVYTYYTVEITIDKKVIKILLIKDVAEQVIPILKSLLSQVNVITMPNFDDTLERKKGQAKFWREILPGLLFLLIILLLFIIFR